MFSTLLAVALSVQAAPQPGAAKPPPLVIAIGQTINLQMSSKRPITQVVVDREGIIKVQPVADDQTTIRITGLAAGVARLHLTDDTGKTETRHLGKGP